MSVKAKIFITNEEVKCMKIFFIFGDRKQISGCLGTGLDIKNNGITTGHKETFDGYVHSLDCGDGFYMSIHRSNHISFIYFKYALFIVH